MSKASTKAQLPDWETPIIDPSTGIVSDQWRFFLTAMFQRSGGYLDGGFVTALETANAISSLEVINERLRSIEARLAALLANTPSQSELQEIRTQVAFVSEAQDSTKGTLQVLRSLSSPEAAVGGWGASGPGGEVAEIS